MKTRTSTRSVVIGLAIAAVIAIPTVYSRGFSQSKEALNKQNKEVGAAQINRSIALLRARTVLVADDSEKKAATGGLFLRPEDDSLAFIATIRASRAVAAINTAEAARSAPGVSYQTQMKLYVVRAGDVLSKIAKKFSVTIPALQTANPALVKSKVVRVGQKIQVPVRVAVAKSTVVAASSVAQDEDFKKLPVLKGYFIKPTDGATDGTRKSFNANDFIAPCAAPVKSAAAGIVISDSADPANSDDGNVIVVEHANGTKTRYAHLESLLVGVGTIVKQGQQIGTVGKTGQTTTCKLKFEVSGARNPFVSA